MLHVKIFNYKNYTYFIHLLLSKFHVIYEQIFLPPLTRANTYFAYEKNNFNKISITFLKARYM